MKKIITITALLFISLCSYSQTVDEVVKSIVDEISNKKIAIVNKRIDSAFMTVDSVVLIKKTASGTFYLDTLFAPINTVRKVQLSLTGTYLNNAISTIVNYRIFNNNGKYFILKTATPETFTGLTGASLSVVVLNGLPVIKIIGTSQIVKWSLKIFSL